MTHASDQAPPRGGPAAADLARAVSDPERLARVRRTGLLDSEPEADFDRLTRVAARVLRAPVAMVTLVDEGRDFVKSCVGLPEPLATAREIAMSPTFCQYAVTTREPLVVADALADARVAAFPAVVQLGARACVVVPLVTDDGHALGSFCVVDFAPRAWTPDEVATLADLAGSVLAAVELRAAAARLAASEATLAVQSERTRLVAENATAALFMMDRDGHPTYMNAAATAMTGFTLDEIAGLPLHYAVHHHRPDGSLYPMAECPIDRALPENFDVRAHEDTFVRKDGTFFPVLCAASPILERGVPVGTVVEVRDVTAERAAAAALRQLGAALQEQNDQLQEHGLELELSNQQLQDQTTELEAQTEELQATAAELEERTDAAELAQLAAQAAEAQLQAVFTQAPAAVVVTAGPGHRFVMVNPRAQAIAGRGALVGRTYREAFPELEAQGFVALLDRVYASGEPYAASEVPVRVEREGGLAPVEGWYDFVYQPLRDGAGGVMGIMQHAVDVTERVQAREAMAESERQFRTMADAIPTLAWTARADGYIDWYNARWYEYTGTTPTDMAGWGWQSVHDAAVLPDVLARWTRSIDSGEPFEMTFPLRGADGRFRPFLTRVTPSRGADGGVARWFGTNTDVGAERAARDAAVEAAARTERLQSLTAALAAAVSADEVASVVVLRAAVMAGAATAALCAHTPGTDAVTTLRQTGLDAAMRERYARFTLATPGPTSLCLRTGEPVFVERRDGPDGLLARFPDVSDVWEQLGTHALATVPLSVGGAVTGAMSFTFDAPRALLDADRAFLLAVGQQAAQALERARLLGAEREARAAAESANRAKADFLSTMSHELRTPLNAIGGYAELLELGVRGPVSPAQAADLARIRRAGQYLQSLINDILNFARLEAGQVAFEPRAVPVGQALADVEALVAPQVAARGLEPRREGCGTADADAAPGTVWADPEKLQQILLNLLTNAIKFTEPGGRITLACALEPGDGGRPGVVRLSVSDTGRGIAADQLARIFEPFVQVDRHLVAASQQGVGLGLAISRDLARGMGGDLTVRSAVGAGSTFTLSLPDAPPA